MKTLNQLRQALLDTVADVRDKKISAEEAIAISKNAQTVINLTRLELDFLQIKNDGNKNVEFLALNEPDDTKGKN